METSADCVLPLAVGLAALPEGGVAGIVCDKHMPLGRYGVTLDGHGSGKRVPRQLESGSKWAWFVITFRRPIENARQMFPIPNPNLRQCTPVPTTILESVVPVAMLLGRVTVVSARAGTKFVLQELALDCHLLLSSVQRSRTWATWWASRSGGTAPATWSCRPRQDGVKVCVEESVCNKQKPRILYKRD